MAKEEFIDFVYMMHLQNTNGRESTNEMFRLGIEAAYDEMIQLIKHNITAMKIINTMPFVVNHSEFQPSPSKTVDK